MAYPDISHWIPVKNWAEAKKTCPFIISKATQGTGYVDPTLKSFIRGCEDHKIPYWLYTFLNRGNERGQAEYMVKVCKPLVGKYFQGYVLDIEQHNSAAGVKSALDYLKGLGGKCMIYTMYSQYNMYQGLIHSRGSKCAWWEARYGPNNGKYNSAYAPHAGVDLHQFTSNGKVAGIGYPVDLNRITGKKKKQWFTGEKVKRTKKLTTLQLAVKVIKGEYGTVAKQKELLGNRYNEVKNFLSHIQKASTATLAKEVIANKYGTGATRKTVLGKRYADVQKAVNRQVKK
jgi:GH25 family lysozyme M1 (1,4-beta-N-acetylmuramidase)